MRQATRELVKSYIHGLDSAELDDEFELLAWNQGIGYQMLYCVEVTGI